MDLISISLLLGSFQFLTEQIMGSTLGVLMGCQGGCGYGCTLFHARRCELGTSPTILGPPEAPMARDRGTCLGHELRAHKVTYADSFQNKVALSTRTQDGLTTFQRHRVQYRVEFMVFSGHCCGVAQGAMMRSGWCLVNTVNVEEDVQSLGLARARRGNHPARAEGHSWI